jgi:hypothetical protein
MKIKTILFVLCFVPILSTFAQTKAFQFGFKVAPNMGWVKPDATDYERIGTSAGFNWGFTGEFFIMENYAFNTGFNVIYLNGGYSYRDLRTLTGETTEKEGLLKRELLTQYLQVPVILKMKTNDFNGIRIYGQAGFGLAYLFRAKADDVFIPDQGQTVIDKRKEVKPQLRPMRESLILGAGVEIPIGGSTFITAGLLFDNGFIDVLKDQNKVDPTVDKSAITNFIELQISLLF